MRLIMRFTFENEIDNEIEIDNYNENDYENDSYLLLSKNHASDYRGWEEAVNYRSARVARIVPANVEERQNNFSKKS